MAKMIKVTVTVPQRGDYPGVWHGGKLWKTGKTETEVTEDELKKLRERPFIAVATGFESEVAAKIDARDEKIASLEAELKAAKDELAAKTAPKK